MRTRDDNNVPVAYGVSHLDGITPVKIMFNTQRGMMVDDSTTIAFDPLTITTSKNGTPLAMGTSSADDTTVLPWVVNAFTGAVLIDKI